MERARRVAQGTEGHLTLCFVGLTPYPTISGALRRFRSECPGVTFTIEEASTSQQLEMLEHDKMDLGFVRTPGRDLPHLALRRVHREPICIALPASHARAGEDEIILRQLAQEPSVSTARIDSQGFFDQLRGEEEFTPVIGAEHLAIKKVMDQAGLTANK